MWNLALGSQAKAHAIKATPLSATCPRHLHAPAELLHLHAPGRSRLPFARPQTLQTLPQASKATTLTATTCPCHLFFRGFKTAVCPPSNPPSASNAPAGLQGNNSYSYMPLPSVFQGVQDCRLPALKPPKRFQRSRRPSRQQLLQLHVLKPSKRFQPSRRPPRPCHLFFRGFKTAVCPASNPPNASAGLQGNNSYSYYMPLPSVFQGVQDCRLPALKPPKRFQRSRRPPRQQLLQLHAPAICFSGGSRLPFARPQTPQTLPTLPQAFKATTLTATCPQTLQTLPTLSQASKALPSVFQGVQDCRLPALKPPNASNALAGLQGKNSYSYMPLPSVFQGVQDCRLPALKPPKRFQRSRRPPRQQLLQLHVLKPSKRFQPSRRPPRPCHLFFRGFKTAVCPPSNPPNASNAPAGLQGNNSYSYMSLPSVFQGVQDCRRKQRHTLHAPAICFSGGSRLPALKPPPPTLPQASKATTLTATCPCHASARLQGNNSYSYYMPLPSVFQGVKASKATTLTATCPQTLQTLPTLSQASKAICFSGGQGLQGNNSYSYMSNAPAGLQGNNSYSYMPLPSVFHGVQDCRLPALKPPKRFQRSRRPPRQQLLQLHVQRSRRPPRQQLLQLHAPAICVSGGSRLPFAWPQTPQTLPTLPQASKATTLTATCPCHLFFRGFKTAVCPPSNPPNASNAPAGLQGNNSYSYMSLPSVFQGVQDCRRKHSYMPLPSVFQGVQDCRLPGLKPSKRFQPSRRPPRQQLLQLAPGTTGGVELGSRVASKGTRHQGNTSVSYMPQTSTCSCRTLTPTCPRTFKTAVCPASNPPNASAGLQGNNSYSYYMPLPSVFQGVQDCRLPALKPPKRFQRSRRPPRQQLLQLHAPAICFSGGSRLPFARPHNPPNASNAPAGLQGNNSYSYMSSNPPNASNPLAGLQGPAICFSGGSRLPFARPQTPQTLPTLPQASKATTLTATCPQTLQTLPTLSQASKATTLTATCPCHLFFTGFKTAVCPPSNPPNASNALAGLQGNNSYSYMSDAPAGLQGNNSYSYMPLPSVFQGVQDCRLPGPKPPKRFQPSRRPPRQQLLQLHAPAICFSGGSRLPFARPQTPQTLPTLPQASKAATLTATCPCHLFFRGFKTAVASTATCPCHLFFRGFKTAVCPASNPPNASNAPAGLQGNNSYSYMPLPSVFQGVQDCRLPALKPPKRFQRSRRPPRQQLLQLHVPAICFSGGSRLPSQAKAHATFARPQTLQTLLHASKETTLTATTCPCHLFFRGFKASKATTLTATCPQTLQTLPTLSQASKATTLTATCPCHLFFTGFKTAVCPPSNPLNASNALAGLQGNNSYSYMSNAPAGLQGNNSYSYMPLPSVFQGVQDCRLPGPKPPKRFQPSRRPPRQQLLQLHAPAICFSGGSRLPFARPQTPQTLPTLPQASKATTLTATCPCHLFFRGFKTAVASTATCPCHLFFRGFKTAVCPASNPPNASSPPAGLQGNNSYSYMPLPSVFQGVQDCRLPALKPPKRFQRSRRPPRQQLLQLHVPAICFSGGSRLPSQAKAHATFARPQTLQTLLHASKATTLTATTCPCHLFFRGFKTAVCPPSNPPNASNAPAGLQGNNSYSYMPLPSVFHGVQDCRLPGLKRPKRFQPSRRPPRQQLLQLHAPAICFSGGSRLPFARPQTPQTLPTLPQASKATTLTATCPCHLFFRGFKTAVASKGTRNVCPASNPPNASARLQGNNSYSYYMPLPSVFQGVQDCRLPALNPPKRFQRSRRPPRQQLLQLHAPAICFSRGSRLPFARPQTSQTLPTLPQASKATTLTATCPCHLFFKGFKTAVCPPSNPPNASNAPAGLQGNNSYSYMSLPSVFQGVQDCRRKQRHTPSRQHLCQLHAQPSTCSCPTLTPTCPCHLFFRTFKTTVCPASNPPNASAGLQGNNSYSSYMPLPSVFQGVQDCRLPAFNPPKRFQPSRRPPRQQLLQLHAPAICFSGGSRLPFARPQTPQTLPTLPQASKATTLAATCPCHLFFRGFKTAVCSASNPPNASNPPAGLQGNNSYSYMPLPSVFQGVQDCRLPALKPPKRFEPSRR